MSAANGKSRECAACGQPVNRYNTEDRCYSCQRSGIPPRRPPGERRRRVPDYLPGEILARADFRDACTRHDFGAMFLIINEYKDQGWTFSHIGRRCEMANIRIYTRCGTQPESLHVIERVSDGLHIPGDMLGIGRRPWESEYAGGLSPQEFKGDLQVDGTGSPRAENFDGMVSSWLGDVDDEEVMRRRAFLLDIAVLAGLGAKDAAKAVESIRHELNHSLAEQRATADIDEWNEISLEYGESYPVTAPNELLSALMVDVLGLRTTMRRYTDEATQRELLRVGALLGGFTAQTITNLGQPREARRWWRTAKQAADRSGDSYCALWVRGREIVRAMEDRPIPAILRLAGEAEEVAKRAPTEVVLELLGGKAQTLALAGRRSEAEETLTQLRERFNKRSASSSGYSGSVLAWGEERLHHTESFAYSRLGDLQKAETALRLGLALYDKNNQEIVRWPAQLELNYAFALVRSGDVGEGLNHAQAVITRMPDAQRGKPVIDDGRKLLAAVPAHERQRPFVQEYDDWLSALSNESVRQLLV